MVQYGRESFLPAAVCPDIPVPEIHLENGVMILNQLKSMRRGCTRIGFALLGYLAAAYLCVYVLELLVYWFWPEGLLDMNFLMVLSDVSTYGVGALIFWLILEPLPTAAVPQRSMTPVRFSKLLIEAIGVMYSASLLTSLIIAVISVLTGQELTNILSDTVDTMSVGSMFFFTVIVAPICEELIFRGILFRRLLPMGQKFAIVISALAFGLYHCNLYQFFYATAIGLLFGCIVAKTGRIRYTIVLHAVLNFLGSVLVTILEPYPGLSVAYTVIIYLLMLLGLFILAFDFRSLTPAAPCLPGCWKAARTSPGMILCFIVMAAMSISVVFLI